MIKTDLLTCHQDLVRGGCYYILLSQHLLLPLARERATVGMTGQRTACAATQYSYLSIKYFFEFIHLPTNTRTYTRTYTRILVHIHVHILVLILILILEVILLLILVLLFVLILVHILVPLFVLILVLILILILVFLFVLSFILIMTFNLDDRKSEWIRMYI